jgi:RND family efflux transporter MFP subunit
MQQDTTKPNQAPASFAFPEPRPPAPGRRRFGTLAALVSVLVAGGVFMLAVWPRMQAGKAIADTQKDTRPTVIVVPAQRAKASTELVLPGTMLPVQEAPIYARTNGYVKRWFADIGDHVKAGQVLAEIETPEIDRELKQVQANLQQARANMELAHSTAERWKAVLKENAVSPQEVDEKVSAYKARQADYAAADANMQRLQQLKGFQRVNAPFDGTITGRNVEVGQLIGANNADPARWMFKLAKMDTLRMYVNVPQSNIRMIKPDASVNIVLREFPKPFVGKVTRTSGALDPQSKTLLTEVQVPNAKGELVAGMYALAKFALSQEEPNILLPSNTLIVRADGPQVAAVENNTVKMRKVALGRDFGTQIEILSGIGEKELIITNPTDAMREGIPVKSVVAQADKPAEKPADNKAPPKPPEKTTDKAASPTDKVAEKK